jgi:hypothetical protein
VSQGSLTINSVNLSITGLTRAWWITDLSPLWFPPDVRGSNVIIPGTAGRRAYTRRVDETVYDLPMVISHQYDRTNGSYADPSNGLQTNVAYLYTNVVAPTIGTTVAATLTLPSGATQTADVQCELAVSDHHGNSASRAVLTLIVPAGRFA